MFITKDGKIIIIPDWYYQYKNHTIDLFWKIIFPATFTPFHDEISVRPVFYGHLFKANFVQFVFINVRVFSVLVKVGKIVSKIFP